MMKKLLIIIAIIQGCSMNNANIENPLVPIILLGSNGITVSKLNGKTSSDENPDEQEVVVSIFDIRDKVSLPEPGIGDCIPVESLFAKMFTYNPDTIETPPLEMKEYSITALTYKKGSYTGVYSFNKRSYFPYLKYCYNYDYAIYKWDTIVSQLPGSTYNMRMKNVTSKVSLKYLNNLSLNDIGYPLLDMYVKFTTLKNGGIHYSYGRQVISNSTVQYAGKSFRLYQTKSAGKDNSAYQLSNDIINAEIIVYNSDGSIYKQVYIDDFKLEMKEGYHYILKIDALNILTGSSRISNIITYEEEIVAVEEIIVN